MLQSLLLGGIVGIGAYVYIKYHTRPLDAHLRVVLAAAIHAYLKKPVRIVHIRPLPASQQWAKSSKLCL